MKKYIIANIILIAAIVILVVAPRDREVPNHIISFRYLYDDTIVVEHSGSLNIYENKKEVEQIISIYSRNCIRNLNIENMNEEEIDKCRILKHSNRKEI